MSFRGKQLKTCAGINLLKKSTINDLPDDILVTVLSLLTMKQAGTTSVLSKRWKDIWAYITTLYFDSCDIIGDMENRIKSLEVEEPKYLYWVDRVVVLHKAPIIDEFKVWFDVAADEITRNRIDKWLRFVVEKRVKRLEINFAVYIKTNKRLRYTFPSLMCNSLTSLVLVSVNVTGKVIESFLCTCPLEYLSVEKSKSLKELTVSGSLLSLKGLRIHYCVIEKLEISAPNLVSVHYFGQKLNIQFKSTPKLAEVSIGYAYADNLVNCLSALSSYLSQIEVLSVFPSARIEDTWMLIENPVFSRLTKLDFTIFKYFDNTLFSLGSLIKACPVLHHLKLQLDRNRERLREAKASPHSHLKVVEIVGFRGKTIDLVIVTFLLQTAVSLEKIIINPRGIYEFEYPWNCEETSRNKRTRMRAIGLREHLKPAVKLEIL